MVLSNIKELLMQLFQITGTILMFLVFISSFAYSAKRIGILPTVIIDILCIVIILLIEIYVLSL